MDVEVAGDGDDRGQQITEFLDARCRDAAGSSITSPCDAGIRRQSLAGAQLVLRAKQLIDGDAHVGHCDWREHAGAGDGL